MLSRWIRLQPSHGIRSQAWFFAATRLSTCLLIYVPISFFTTYCREHPRNVHLHAFVHTHTHTRIYVCIPTYRIYSTYSYTYTYTYLYVQIHRYTGAYIDTYIQTYTYAHTYLQTYIHIYIDTYMQIHTTLLVLHQVSLHYIDAYLQTYSHTWGVSTMLLPRVGGLPWAPSSSFFKPGTISEHH